MSNLKFESCLISFTFSPNAARRTSLVPLFPSLRNLAETCTSNQEDREDIILYVNETEKCANGHCIKCHTIYLSYKKISQLWNWPAGSETGWPTLKPADRLWNRLADFEAGWLTLKPAGRLWNRLADFETGWPTLKLAGRLWNRLADFETGWLALKPARGCESGLNICNTHV